MNMESKYVKYNQAENYDLRISKRSDYYNCFLLEFHSYTYLHLYKGIIVNLS